MEAVAQLVEHVSLKIIKLGQFRLTSNAVNVVVAGSSPACFPKVKVKSNLLLFIWVEKFYNYLTK